MTVHALRTYAKLIALRPVFDNLNGRMIAIGETFYAADRRAAELIAIGVVGLADPDDDSTVAALAAFANDSEIRKCIDRHALMAIADAWGRGLRPD